MIWKYSRRIGRDVVMLSATGYDQAMHRVDPTDFKFSKEFGRRHYNVGYCEWPDGEGPISLICRHYWS